MAGKIITSDKWFDEAIDIAGSALEPLEDDRKKCLEDSMLYLQGYENDSDFLCQALGAFDSHEEEAALILLKVKEYVDCVEYAKKTFAAADEAIMKNATVPVSTGTKNTFDSSYETEFTGSGGKY